MATVIPVDEFIADEPVCVVQARPVTVTAAAADATPTEWNPAAMAAKYVFGT